MGFFSNLGNAFKGAGKAVKDLFRDPSANLSGLRKGLQINPATRDLYDKEKATGVLTALAAGGSALVPPAAPLFMTGAQAVGYAIDNGPDYNPQEGYDVHGPHSDRIKDLAGFLMASRTLPSDLEQLYRGLKTGEIGSGIAGRLDDKSGLYIEDVLRNTLKHERDNSHRYFSIGEPYLNAGIHLRKDDGHGLGHDPDHDGLFQSGDKELVSNLTSTARDAVRNVKRYGVATLDQLPDAFRFLQRKHDNMLLSIDEGDVHPLVHDTATQKMDGYYRQSLLDREKTPYGEEQFGLRTHIGNRLVNNKDTKLPLSMRIGLGGAKRTFTEVNRMAHVDPHTKQPVYRTIKRQRTVRVPSA